MEWRGVGVQGFAGFVCWSRLFRRVIIFKLCTPVCSVSPATGRGTHVVRQHKYKKICARICRAGRYLGLAMNSERPANIVDEGLDYYTPANVRRLGR